MSKQFEIISKNEATILEQIDREKVKSQIYEVRGLRVMLDSDIAAYFGVTTGNLNKAKNRNIERFPENFCFTLSDHEISLFQFGIPMQRKGIKGGRSKDYFFNSVEMQYACSMCIVQIGEMISLLEDDFIRSHPEIPWRQIKGARNIYVHGYGELDLDEVWNTLTESVPLLKNQISELLVNFEEK